MDAKGKHESRERRREETLARRVGEALDQMNPSGADECPDAEIVAAYADRALAQDETVHWESHFATCARCRKILRVLAASSDTPLAESEVARLGELVASARVPSRTAEPLRIARPRAWDWRVRWLAPALGAAAVLAVWLAMRPPWRNKEQGASATLIAQAPKELAPPVSGPTDQRSRNLALEDKEAFRKQASRPNAGNQALYSRSGNAVAGSAPATNELRSAAPRQEADESALQKQKKDALDALASRRQDRLDATAPVPTTGPPSAKTGTAMGAAAASPQSDAKAQVLSSQNAAPSPAPPPPPAPRAKALMETPAASAPLPQAQAKSGIVSPQVPEQPGSTSQTVTVTEAAPVVETANGTLGTLRAATPADLPLNGRDYQPLILLNPAVKSEVSFRAPSGSVLWRTASGGKIERSNDSGGSWQAQASPSREDWLAGAAVSDVVCWLAGHNGAIARTEDGEHWSLVPPPSQAAGSAGKPPDWTGITALDAQSATVTAGDGRRFATADGGKTWQAQR